MIQEDYAWEQRVFQINFLILRKTLEIIRDSEKEVYNYFGEFRH
jgi:hypothetical protein